MKPLLIILIGAPCSGKSTWSKKYVLTHANTLRFNRDDIRMMLAGLPILSALEEHVVTSMIDVGIKDALLSNKDVILDQTNCKLSYINKFVNAFRDISEIKFKIFNGKISELWERNKNRSEETGIPKIPPEIIFNMYRNQGKLLQNEEFKKILEEYGHMDNE